MSSCSVVYTAATALDQVNCHHGLETAIANYASAAPLLSPLRLLMELEGRWLQAGSAQIFSVLMVKVVTWSQAGSWMIDLSPTTCWYNGTANAVTVACCKLTRELRLNPPPPPPATPSPSPSFSP
jgi:hypothetical protein